MGTIVAALTLAIDARASVTAAQAEIPPILNPALFGGWIWTIVVLVILRRSKQRVVPVSPARSTATFAPSTWLVMGMVLFLLPTLVGALVAQLAGLPPFETWTHKQPAMLSGAGYAVSILACVVLAFVAHRRDALSGLLPSARGGAAGILTCVMFLPVIWFVSILIGLCVTVIMPLLGLPEPEPVAHDTLQTLVDTPHDIWWWLLVAGALVGAPIVEEYLFRGVVQGGLLEAGWRVMPCVLVTSTLFTMTHLTAIPTSSWPVALPTLFLLSCVLGVVMERSGSILAPIVVHAMFNAMNLAVALAGA
ncbi:MAG: lysostaphin resistance A-like protein [Planctomycetota bacterium]